MDPIWLQHYPTGVPASISPGVYPSIVDLLTESAARYGEAPACVNFGQAVSYAELDRLSQRFASYLQHEAGLVHGERFAVMMPNLLQFPVALMGCLRAGLIVVPVNPLYSPRELEHQLRDSGARGILVAESSAHTLAEVIDDSPVETVITTSIGEMLPWTRRVAVNAAVKYIKKMVPGFQLPGAVTFSSALAEGGRRPYTPVPLDHDDIALLQYTGGTTGVAKGAILTHGNIIANVEQAGAWLAPWIKPGAETIITALPL